MATVVSIENNQIKVVASGAETQTYYVQVDDDSVVSKYGTTISIFNPNTGQKIYSFDESVFSPAPTPPTTVLDLVNALVTKAPIAEANIVSINYVYDTINTGFWAVAYSNNSVVYYTDTPFGTIGTPTGNVSEDKIWLSLSATTDIDEVSASGSINSGKYYVYVKNIDTGTVIIGATTLLQNEELVLFPISIADPITNTYKTSPSYSYIINTSKLRIVTLS